MEQKKKVICIVLALLILFALAFDLYMYFTINSKAEKLADYVDFGDKYLLEHNYEDALSAYKSAIAIDAKDTGAYLGDAEALIGLGEYEQALEVLQLGYDVNNDSKLEEKIGEVSTIIEQIAMLPQVYEAYATYIETNELEWGFSIGQYVSDDYFGEYNRLVFTLEYVDEDYIPELVYGSTQGIHASNICILKYDDGTVYKIGPVGEYNAFVFYPSKNIIRDGYIGMGNIVDSYEKINDFGQLESIAYSYEYYDDDYEATPLEAHYYIFINNEETEVSLEKYNECLDQFNISDNEFKVWSCYDNEENYPYITDENLELLRRGLL